MEKERRMLPQQSRLRQLLKIKVASVRKQLIEVIVSSFVLSRNLRTETDLCRFFPLDAVEQKYRNSINNALATLRDTIPALRHLKPLPSVSLELHQILETWLTIFSSVDARFKTQSFTIHSAIWNRYFSSHWPSRWSRCRQNSFKGCHPQQGDRIH